MKNGLAFLGILALAALALWYDFNQHFPIKEGLDLQGGMRVILQVDRAELQRKKLNIVVDHDTMTQVSTILENRVNGFGLSGATVHLKGTDQIVVQLPGARNPEQALASLRKTAQLEFRWLKDIQTDKAPGNRYKMNVAPASPTEPERYTFVDEATHKSVPMSEVLSKSELILTGKDLLPKSSQGINMGGGRAEPIVNFEFNAQGGSIFAGFTTKHVDDILAIVLDDEIISAPRIEEPITEGKGIIRGGFQTIAEARNLAALLNSGSLPVPLEVVESQTVGATLGTEAVQRSIYAGLVGLALVLVFMLAYYLLPGLLANIALVFYAALTFAIFKWAGVVIDLPGITGFILSVGMAVDANILIFERLREELRGGKTLHAAIDAGFNRAFTSIFDSNVTTWITCGVLFYLGAPIIKGFALTLAIGVAVSMFTAITVTRTMLHLAVNLDWARQPKLFGLGISWLSTRFGEGRWLEVIGKWRVYFSFSGLILVGGIVFLAMGGLRPGIEFTGGSEVQAVFNQTVSTDQVRSVLTGNGISDAQITRGATNLIWTTASVEITGDLSLSAQEDLKLRLQLIRGFDEPKYSQKSDPGKKSTTVTAVFVTSMAGVSQDAIRSSLINPVRLGDKGRQLAPIPATFQIQRQEELRKDLPVVVITSRQINDVRGRALDRDLSRLGGGYIQPAYQRQTIGPSIASEVTVNAFTSVVVASILIILYLAARFAIGGFVNGLKFGVSAVIALIHDVVSVTGFFALMGMLKGWQIDSLYVTAALTIIGFSVHDTIVVYDRIRENLKNRLRGESFEGVANRSITQTFDRSINTSMTVMLVLAALVFFGGESIHLFSLAMLLGIAIGTYSSVFVASPLVVFFERMSARQAAAKAGRKDDVRFTAGPTSKPRPPAPQRPRPVTQEAPAAPASEETGTAAIAGAPASGRSRSSAGSTIKPKRKRRT